MPSFTSLSVIAFLTPPPSPNLSQPHPPTHPPFLNQFAPYPHIRAMDQPFASNEPRFGLAKLFQTALTVPFWEYVLLLFVLACLALYYAMESHLIADLLNGFKGDPVQLVYGSTSKLAAQILPKCEVLKQRYLATPWLSSPHLQTAFLSFFGRPPAVEYRRQLVRTPDGGTIALDWLALEDYEGIWRSRDSMQEMNGDLDKIPTVVIIPGLTSDSNDAYVKHIAHSIGKKGWRLVVANHRGLGGVSMTSDQFYNAGWTDDLRRIVNYLHHEYPRAPLLAVGTSIGANLLVKYLGEEGDNTPLGAAVAICSPWDLLVCERFICQGTIPKLYNKMLALGLRRYVEPHQSALARLADWELINKSRSMRDFDNYFTVLVGKFETVDTYYRKSSSVFYLNSVSIPLLCISSLDDPVCTKETIPWDECRANPNVVLGITRHGGHLAFFEGFTARSIWWVRATTEFLGNVYSSSVMHMPKKVHVPSSGLSPILETAIDKGPYLKVSETGMVSAEKTYIKPPVMAESFEDTITEEDQEEMAATNVAEQIPQIDQLPSPLTPGLSPSEPSDRSPCNLKLYEKDDRVDRSSCISKTGFEGEKSRKHVHNSVQEEPSHHMLKLPIRNQSELLALELALSRLMLQVQSFKCSLKNEKISPSFLLSPQEETENRSFSNPFLRPLEIPVSSAPVSSIGNCTQTFTCFAGENGKSKPYVGSSVHERWLKRLMDVSTNRDKSQVETSIPKKKGLTAHNRHMLWLLAYVAIVTTWPLVGSVLFLNGQRRLKKLLRDSWLK